MRYVCSSVVLGAMLALSAPHSAFSQYRYKVVDLGTFGPSTLAKGVNDSGQVTGISGGHGFFWDAGTLTDVGTLGIGSFATAINNAGQVVGSSDLNNANEDRHAFLWQSGVMTDLSPSDHLADAADINDAGVVVGESYLNDSAFFPVRWVNGIEETVDIGGEGHSIAVNRSGKILALEFLPGGFSHGLLWDNGALRDIGNFSTDTFYNPTCINDSDVVAGVLSYSGTPIQQLFLWRNGVITEAGFPHAGNYFVANAINNFGDVAGYSGSTAFLYQNHSFIDLNTVIDPAGGWHLERAQDINNKGAIVGVGTHNGQQAAFLLDPNPLTVERPQPSQHWNVNTQDTIRWTGRKENGWEVFLSTDGGTSFVKFDTALGMNDTSLLWTPPDSFRTSSTCYFKVRDILDTNLAGIGGRFTIRSYDLARMLPDSSFRYFKPSVDGWRFVNDTNPMWPAAWWGQFQYRTMIDPYTGRNYPTTTSGVAMAFVAPRAFPDWPLFVDVFGVNQCYVRGFFGSLDYNQAAASTWLVISDGSGSCNGMSNGSLMNFDFPSNFRAQFPHLPGFAFAHDAQITDSLRKALNELQIFQFGAFIAQNSKANETTDPRTTLGELKKRMLSDSLADDVTLTLRDNVHTGAHEVLPCRLERDAIVPGQFHVFVYDPNNPDSDNVYIDIDSIPNTWTDHLPGLGFGTGQTGCFIDAPIPAYFASQILPPAASHPPDSRPGAPLIGANDERVYCTTTSNAVLRGPAGDSIGYRDSVTFNNMSGGSRVIPIIGRFAPPIGYDLPAGKYAAVMDGFTDTSAAFTILDSGTIYRCERGDAQAGEKDIFGVGSGLSMKNPDAATKHLSLITIASNDTASFAYRLEGLAAGPGDSSHLRQSAPDALTLQNFGGAKSFDFFFERTDSSGLHSFAHNGVTLAGNAAMTIAVPGDTLVAVKLLIDTGNDGTIDDSLLIDNLLTTVPLQRGLGIPGEYRLEQNYPNPFNPSTTIRFDVPQSGHVALRVYDLLGRLAAVLVDGRMEAGRYARAFDAGGLASGVYFYRLEAGPFSATKRFVLMK